MEIFFVLQGETVAAGTLVGVSGQKQWDTSSTLTNNIKTRQGLELTIYHTWGEHASNYLSDVA
jgi:hypothetical protein